VVFPEVTVTGISVSGSGPVTITAPSPVTISGSITVTSAPITGNFDNDLSNDDILTIDKTVDIFASGTISGTTLTLDPGSSYTVGGADNIDINSLDDPPIDISAPETGSLDLSGQTITLTVPPALSGIIFDGIVLGNVFFIAHEGVEQIHLGALLGLGARTQVGGNPAVETELFVFLRGHGSITHLDIIEVTGTAVVIAGGPFNFPLGLDDILAEGAFSLQCNGAGLPSMICDLSIDFDGSSVEFGLPISGTIVINFLETSLESSGTGFFSMTEYERMTIDGVEPEWRQKHSCWRYNIIRQLRNIAGRHTQRRPHSQSLNNQHVLRRRQTQLQARRNIELRPHGHRGNSQRHNHSRNTNTTGRGSRLQHNPQPAGNARHLKLRRPATGHEQRRPRARRLVSSEDTTTSPSQEPAWST
jgi:hypothetical protein